MVKWESQSKTPPQSPEDGHIYFYFYYCIPVDVLLCLPRYNLGSSDCEIPDAGGGDPRLPKPKQYAWRNHIILIVDCVLFTLFGLVLTVQAVQISLVNHLDAVMVQSSWTSVSCWYAVLSLSAKLVLERGFITLLVSTDFSLHWATKMPTFTWLLSSYSWCHAATFCRQTVWISSSIPYPRSTSAPWSSAKLTSSAVSRM